jgi:hypothetical protein
MKAGHFKVAKAFIQYRERRANTREGGVDATYGDATMIDAIAAPLLAPGQSSLIVVKKLDGTNSFRDGLIIALLALRPLRLRNWTCPDLVERLSLCDGQFGLE